MKRLFILLTALLFISMGTNAQGGRRHMTPEEYRTKQKEYIIRHAELTPEEAEKFFPIFFELQQKKWEVNAAAWNAIPHKEPKNGKPEELTDEQYETLMYELADAKINEAKLNKEYLQKYKQILSAKKILDVQRAEDGFQRDLLKKMIEGRNNKRQNGKKEERGAISE